MVINYTYNNSQSITLFPINLHNPKNGIPFSTRNSLRVSHFPPGLQHRLSMKYDAGASKSSWGCQGEDGYGIFLREAIVGEFQDIVVYVL
jgi:hypothetical protein